MPLPDTENQLIETDDVVVEFPAYCQRLLEDLGIEREKLSLREQHLYDLTVQSVDRALSTIHSKFEDPSRTDNTYLAYHNTTHTIKVIERTAAILMTLQHSDPSVTTSTIMIGMMEAAWHDVVQDFEIKNEKRARGNKDNEEKSARELWKYLQNQEGLISKNLPPEALDYLTEENLVRDIDTTEPNWAEIPKEVYGYLYTQKLVTGNSYSNIRQPKLGPESSVIAKALALADLGTAGMDDPEQIWLESWRVFFEEHLHNFDTARADGFIDSREEDRLLSLIYEWMESQKKFILTCYGSFHTTAKALFSPEEFERLRVLFPNFADSQSIKEILEKYDQKKSHLKKKKHLRSVLEHIDPRDVTKLQESAEHIRVVREKRAAFLSKLAIVDRLFKEQIGGEPFIAHASTALAVMVHQIKDFEGFAGKLSSDPDMRGAFEEAMRPPTDNDYLTTDAGFDALHTRLLSNDISVGGLRLQVTEAPKIQEKKGLRSLEAKLQIDFGDGVKETIDLDVWTGITKKDDGTLLLTTDRTDPTKPKIFPLEPTSYTIPAADHRRIATIQTLPPDRMKGLYIEVWMGEFRRRNHSDSRTIDQIRSAPMGEHKNRRNRLKFLQEILRHLTTQKEGVAESQLLHTIEESVREIGTISLHQHFEGTLSPHHLQEVVHEIESRFKIDLGMSTDLWDQIYFLMSHRGDENQDIHSFIGKLSTRWMRLIMVKGILRGVDGHDILAVFFEKIRDLATADNVKEIEMLTSALAFCAEGNLARLTPPDTKYLLAEEVEAYREWDDRATRVPLLDPAHTPTIRSFYQRYKEFATTDHRVAMSTRLCIRREQDRIFTNKKFKPNSELAQTLRQLYESQALVGIDIAGPELATNLSEFTNLFSFLRTHHIPFTVHAGEIGIEKDEHRLQAYRNLFTAVEYGAKRIGHAVRLFDTDSQYAIDLLHYTLLQEPPIYFEMNLRSNIWTQVVDSMGELHPLILALRRDHPLFARTPYGDQLYEKFLDRLIICHDDPHVVDTEDDDENLIREIEAVILAMGDADGWNNPEKIKAFVKRMYENGLRARLPVREPGQTTIPAEVRGLMLRRKLVAGPEKHPTGPFGQLISWVQRH